MKERKEYCVSAAEIKTLIYNVKSTNKEGAKKKVIRLWIKDAGNPDIGIPDIEIDEIVEVKPRNTENEVKK